jgi:hypothetical protein
MYINVFELECVWNTNIDKQSAFVIVLFEKKIKFPVWNFANPAICFKIGEKTSQNINDQLLYLIFMVAKLHHIKIIKYKMFNSPWNVTQLKCIYNIN